MYDMINCEEYKKRKACELPVLIELPFLGVEMMR